MTEVKPDPAHEPALRTFAMPADANPNGDIFGGWLMSQMDMAGAVAAMRRAHGRVATVAVDAMTFHKPVMIGDLVSCYAEVARVGRTSMTVKIEAFVERRLTRAIEKVTAATFTYVALDSAGRPRPVDSPPVGSPS
ncbi:MAG TPA: acyl-CoA thioesterase [Candidatus Acidoferrum sp.]|nr:acyl-CoA thioesterase [Candidatus Acidoferrum sp.]